MKFNEGILNSFKKLKLKINKLKIRSFSQR